jgi:hypothetical protein
MTSTQYEELCRLFLSEQLHMPIEQIWTLEMPSPWRPGLIPYRHQIDLFWKFEDAVGQYLSIANAKWRGTEKVDQPEVLLLQQVKLKVGAHKAVMITNYDFTAGARAAAADDHIALHIVRPVFDYRFLHAQDALVIRGQLQEVAGRTASLYSHEVIRKGFDAPATAVAAAVAPPRRTFTLKDAAALPAGFLPGMGSPPAADQSQGPPPPAAYPTRQGGGPGYRTK